MPAFSNGYTYARALTVDGSAVRGGLDLVDFPVLVLITDPGLKSAANGGKVQHPSGYDLRFELGNGTVLDYEAVVWGAASGTLVAYVRIPLLSASTGATFYLFYGNAAVTTSQQNAAGVWRNGFAAVFHFGDGTTLSLLDSTGNGHTLTNVGGVTAAAGPGGIPGAAVFNGAPQVLTCTPNTDITTLPLTIEAWVQTSLSTVTQDIANVGSSDSPGHTYGLEYRPNGVVRCTATSNHAGDTAAFTDSATGVYSLGTWAHAAAVQANSGSHLAFYNGAQVASSSVVSVLAGTVTNLSIGGRQLGNWGNYATAHIAEARYSTVARSSGWLATTNAALSDPATFVTVGSETTAGSSTTTYTRTVAVGATLTKARQRTARADAVLRSVGTTQLAVDAQLRQAHATTLQLDTVVAQPATRRVVPDAVLTHARAQTVALDAVLCTTAHRTLAGDAVLAQTASRTLAFNAVLRGGPVRLVTLGAVLRAAGTRTLAVDSLLAQVDQTRTLSLDAVTTVAHALPLQLDAALARGTTRTVDLMALLVAPDQARAVALDAVLAPPPVAFTLTIESAPSFALAITAAPALGVTVTTAAPFALAVSTRSGSAPG